MICYKSYLPIDTEQSCHLIISKQDGSVTREIQIPFKEIKTPKVVTEDVEVTPAFYLTFPYHGSWVLVNTSSDIVYTYLPDNTISPFIVRTPSIHSMDPEVFLFPSILSALLFYVYPEERG